MVARLIRGETNTAPFPDGFISMCEVGWKSLGALELTALPVSMKSVGSAGPRDGCPASGMLLLCIPINLTLVKENALNILENGWI